MVDVLAVTLPCGIMIFAIILQIGIFAVAIGSVVFWIFMLIDVIQRKKDQFPNKSDNEQLIWILVVVLTGWVGALIYYFVVYKKLGKAKTGKE